MTSVIPQNLRINADDFGLSPPISRAVVAAAQGGLVNSVSAVPFRDAESTGFLRQLLEIPNLRVGAHLTFLEMPLLTRPDGFPNGKPPGNYRAFLRAYLERKIGPNEAYAEWAAQLNLLQNRLGDRRVSHLDSHQHIHLLPGLWQTAKRLQAEFQIPLLRIPRENSMRAMLKDPPFGLALQFLASLRHDQNGEHFFGMGASMRFDANAYASVATRILREPERNFELMVHPGEDERGQKEIRELRSWLEKLKV